MGSLRTGPGLVRTGWRMLSPAGTVTPALGPSQSTSATLGKKSQDSGRGWDGEGRGEGHWERKLQTLGTEGIVKRDGHEGRPWPPSEYNPVSALGHVTTCAGPSLGPVPTGTGGKPVPRLALVGFHRSWVLAPSFRTVALYVNCSKQVPLGVSALDIEMSRVAFQPF